MWTVSASQSVGSPASQVTFTGSNYRNPLNSAQFTPSFFGDPVGDKAVSGTKAQCTLSPNFNNSVGLVVGSGNGMRVSHVAVVGPNTAYRAT